MSGSRRGWLVFDFDLLYILTHPLLKAIDTRCAELSEQALALPEASPERRKIEKRIAELEEYRLPKPDSSDSQRSRRIVDRYGRVVGEAHSVRRRFKQTRRGRPAAYRLQARDALEEKLANPKLTWSRLVQRYKAEKYQYHFKDARDLERAVRRLKALLRREEIPLPPSSAYPPPE